MEQNKEIFDNISISEEIRESFLSYAMSVIVSRALPDARDGLKPVHRRILHAMNDLRMTPNSQYKKSARLVGEVIGKYHPHGDAAVYETIVRLVQDFNMRYPLIQGHGNFGSVDGDSAAAMRYTEIKMSKITSEMLLDIDKNTVDFQDNYDGSESEPVVMPAAFPNLLINGTTGIAVGMATSIPPHNLNNVVDALLAKIDNPLITIEELISIIQAPDFPTGGIVSSISRIHDSYIKGSGSVVLQGKTRKEDNSIIIYEIPYQTNKARLIEKIADLVKNKLIDGISDLRDESNKDGIRVVIELKKNADYDFVLNNIFKNTNLQTTFNIHYLALVNNIPKTLNLDQMLQIYLNHQQVVLERKTNFDLQKAKKREHILKGLHVALENIDEIINIIKKSKTASDANTIISQKYNLSEIQASAILEMKLQRLVGLEKINLEKEIDNINKLITDLSEILSDKTKFWLIIKNQLNNIKRLFGDERRTEISNIIENIEDESLIKKEDIVMLLSENNYIKKIPLEEYRSQHRGGTGSNTIGLNEEDLMDITVFGQTHDYFLFFTTQGRVYKIKGYSILSQSKQSKGKPIVNIFENIKVNNDKVKAILRIIPEEFESEDSLVFLTKYGLVKKTKIQEYSRINKNGKIAINLYDGDEIVSVLKASSDNNIIVSTAKNRALRFDSGKIRNLSRNSKGVKAINLKYTTDNYVLSATTDQDGEFLLCITDQGYGKLIDINNSLRIKGRGTMGLPLVNSKHEIGRLVAVKSVNNGDEIILVSKKGKVIRISTDDVTSRKSRVSKGVKIMELKANDLIKSVTVIHDVKNSLINHDSESIENPEVLPLEVIEE